MRGILIFGKNTPALICMFLAAAIMSGRAAAAAPKPGAVAERVNQAYAAAENGEESAPGTTTSYWQTAPGASFAASGTGTPSPSVVFGVTTGAPAPSAGAQAAASYPAVPYTLRASADRQGQPAEWFIYAVVILVCLGAAGSLLSVRRALISSGFSLGDAVSEETEMTPFADGRPLTDAAGAPILVTVMRSSVSRVIALCGGVVILLLYTGFGVFTLFHFAVGNGMPQGAKDVSEFLLSGMTLFAPYTINRFSSLFDGFSAKNQAGGGAVKVGAFGSGALNVEGSTRADRPRSPAGESRPPVAG